MNSTTVINFQITPYSDLVAERINSLSQDMIYRLFNNSSSSDVLTAALYAIYKFESNNSSNNRSIQTTCSENAYFRDSLLFDQNINELGIYPNVFVVVVDGIYFGHVYAWIVNKPDNTSQVTNVCGMRSRSNICEPIDNSIILIFLDAIHKWINPGEQNYIRILQPIGATRKLLMRCGFIMAKSIRNDDDMGWLFDNGSIGNTTLGSELIFREYDYIIARKLSCTTPSYQYSYIN